MLCAVRIVAYMDQLLNQGFSLSSKEHIIASHSIVGNLKSAKCDVLTLENLNDTMKHNRCDLPFSILFSEFIPL